MPALSRQQQKWAFAVKGPEWARAHHFDTIKAQRGTPNVGLHIFQRHIAISRPKAPAEGKHPAITYPPGHLVGMRVPHGGSCCAKCKFVSADKKSCGNHLFVKWNNGDPKLPDPALEYCCDLYQD